MKMLRSVLFVMLALPTFVVAWIAGVAFFGLYSGFVAGVDTMKGLSK